MVNFIRNKQWQTFWVVGVRARRPKIPPLFSWASSAHDVTTWNLSQINQHGKLCQKYNQWQTFWDFWDIMQGRQPTHKCIMMQFSHQLFLCISLYVLYWRWCTYMHPYISFLSFVDSCCMFSIIPRQLQYVFYLPRQLLYVFYLS